jgi:hypothetical protein
MSLGQPWTYGSWIYNYLCNQCLSPLVASSNPVHGKMNSIQHYVIKYDSDLRQVRVFLRVLRLPHVKMLAYSVADHELSTVSVIGQRF